MVNDNLHKLIFVKNKDYKKLFNSKPSPALFLDRDGVILKENDHLSDPNRVELEKGIKNLMEYFTRKKIPIVIITNQSGIANKKYKWKDYENVTKKMLFLLGTKVFISAIYANGEDRNSKKFIWRKPSPKMILLAREELNLNLENSILIGDRNSDLEAGLNAKIKNLVHLKTGHGEAERELIINNFLSLSKKNINIQIFDDLGQIPISNFKTIFNI